MSAPLARRLAGHGISADAVRFVLFGIGNTAATALLYEAALFVLPSGAAYTLAYVAGLVAAVYVYPRFVFRDATARPGGLWPTAAVLATYAIVYGCGRLMLAALTPELSPRLAIAAVLVTNAGLSFALLRLALRAGGRAAS